MEDTMPHQLESNVIYRRGAVEQLVHLNARRAREYMFREPKEIKQPKS